MFDSSYEAVSPERLIRVRVRRLERETDTLTNKRLLEGGLRRDQQRTGSLTRQEPIRVRCPQPTGTAFEGAEGIARDQRIPTSDQHVRRPRFTHHSADFMQCHNRTDTPFRDHLAINGIE